MVKSSEEKKRLVKEKIEEILSNCTNESEFTEAVYNIRMQCFFHHLMLEKINNNEAKFIMDTLDEFIEKHESISLSNDKGES